MLKGKLRKFIKIFINIYIDCIGINVVENLFYSELRFKLLFKENNDWRFFYIL